MQFKTTYCISNTINWTYVNSTWQWRRQRNTHPYKYSSTLEHEPYPPMYPANSVKTLVSSSVGLPWVVSECHCMNGQHRNTYSYSVLVRLIRSLELSGVCEMTDRHACFLHIWLCRGMSWDTVRRSCPAFITLYKNQINSFDPWACSRWPSEIVEIKSRAYISTYGEHKGVNKETHKYNRIDMPSMVLLRRQ